MGMPASSKKKPATEEDDRDIRARILAAAVKTIEQGGLADVSMREVARRAGVSHQLPYHYFTDREGTLAAIAEEGFAILGERLEKAIAPEEDASQRFAAAGRAYVAFALDHPAHFRVMFRADFVQVDRFPGAMACADGAFARLLEVVHANVEEGLPAEPSELALIVLGWSVTHGLSCLLLDGPLAKKLPEAANAKEAIVRDVMEAMRRMVVASSAGHGHKDKKKDKKRKRPS